MTFDPRNKKVIQALIYSRNSDAMVVLEVKI